MNMISATRCLQGQRLWWIDFGVICRFAVDQSVQQVQDVRFGGKADAIAYTLIGVRPVN